MTHFPAFIRLDNLRVLIVGGGNIALRKLEYMLDFTSEITIISSQISPKMNILIKNSSLVFHNRAYKEGDIEGFKIVIVAVNDIEIQKSIYNESRDKGILCNCVDSIDYCDFLFGSYIKNGDLTISISTSGVSPSVAKYFKRYLQKMIPSSLSEFLIEMKELRETLPKGKKRMKLLSTKAKNYFKKLEK